MTTSLKNKLVRSTFINVTLGVSIKFLAVAQSIILARIFAPAEMGLMASAMLVVSFASLFTRMGFEEQIVRVDEVLVLNLIVGSVLFVLLFLTAPVIAGLLKNPGLSIYIRVMGFLVFDRALCLPRSLWSRDFRFGYQKIPAFIEIIVSLSAVLIMYYIFLLGVWSLFYGRLAGFGVRCAMIWILSTYRPVFRFRLHFPPGTIKFGIPLLVSGIMNYFIYQVDDIWVRYFYGESSLGYYVMAFTIPFYLRELVDLISEVFLPAFSELKNSKTRMEEVFRKSNEYISILVIGLGMGIYVFATPLVNLALGQKWLPSVPLLKLFMIAFILMSAVGYHWGMVVIASGNTPLLMYTNIFHTIFLSIAGGYLIDKFGSLGGGYLHIIHTVIGIAFIRLPILWKEMRSVRFLQDLWKPVISGLLSALISSRYLVVYATGIFELFSGLVIFASAYVLFLYLVDRKLIHDFIDMVKIALNQKIIVQED
jgi:O-antigen/teichoic acid export membrane protein